MIKGFKYSCDAGIERIVLSENIDPDINKKIKTNQPDVILAIGIEALNQVKSIKDIPIVYLMVLNPQSVISNQQNITGISINIGFEKQISLFLEAMPSLKRIGTIYNPDVMKYIADDAKSVTKNKNIELIMEAVQTPKDFFKKLIEMKGKIDAFWMLPDISLITPENIELLFLFSMENKVPVLTFSEKYFKQGALMTIFCDPLDVGRQGGVIAREIILGKKVSSIKPQFAENAVVSFNLKIVEKLGIKINNNIKEKNWILK
ncbi:MAG: hypothetical protein HQK79_03200 [Desulfobacterales bacterium]|nr:hypothetical protein [Desulfobacterales bacterium]